MKWQLLKQSSVQTILVLALYLFLADVLPVEFGRLFYTTALFIKDLLMWIMPLTVGFFLAFTVLSFKQKAPLFLVVLLIFEACSNFISVWYAFGWGQIATSYIPDFHAAAITGDFQPFWTIPLKKPSWWSADKGCIFGVIIGACGALKPSFVFTRFICAGKKLAETVMAKLFARLIPLFVLGFAAQMYQTKLLQQVLTEHCVLTAWLVAILALYIVLLFAVGSLPHLQKLFPSIQNLMPAGLIALTSASSLSTMPWTIQGSAKNLDDPELAQAVIPATTNIQQIGDCITNAFICFMTYVHFYGVTPDISMWLTFSVIFTIARFSTAAVIGGAIFVMLPIYETYLNFTPEMIAIILALNVILDPLVTATNVVSNGALCRIFERVWKKLQPSKSAPEAIRPLSKLG
jgi:Na+/H+-dicarboxylate symporter